MSMILCFAALASLISFQNPIGYELLLIIILEPAYSIDYYTLVTAGSENHLNNTTSGENFDPETMSVVNPKAGDFSGRSGLENAGEQDKEKKKEKEREEKERAERERPERDRAERDKQDREKAERERAERDRQDRERAERERADRDWAARERADSEQADRERAERERADQERVARERAERERAERQDRERQERERAERERADRDWAARERADREQADRERAERERADQDRAARERAERDRADRERAETERAERERINREREEREREEQTTYATHPVTKEPVGKEEINKSDVKSENRRAPSVRDSAKDRSDSRRHSLISVSISHVSDSVTTSVSGVVVDKQTGPPRYLERRRGDAVGTALGDNPHPPKTNIDLYNHPAPTRTRKGSFNFRKDPGASRDRDLVGKTRQRWGINFGEIRTDDLDEGTAKRIKAFGGKTDYARSNYQLVRRNKEGKGEITRYYLIDEGGRRGYAVPRYDGRNYHFYSALQRAWYKFEDDYDDWDRRYCFDPWEYYFDWGSEILIPRNYRDIGLYYFEPCYAFSYTFNHGYERGYYEGYAAGVEDWNARRPYDSRTECYAGYDPCLGSYYEYTDGYDQGYIQGYFAGYCGYPYGWNNFGFGDFDDYPVIYDFDYDYIPQGKECFEGEPREPN